jgi:soluble lytic murein transglycosylase
MIRRLAVVAVALGAVAGAAAWVTGSDPEWYERLRYPLRYEQIVVGHADNYRLDPALLAAVIYTESRFRPDARSDAGALGLMQLLPETARGIAVRTGGTAFVVSDLLEPELNVRYGAWYLRHLLERYGDQRTALAAYHAGQGNVDDWRSRGSSIAFPETRAYVDKVLRVRNVYADAYDGELGVEAAGGRP